MVKVAGPVEAAASLRRVLGNVADYFTFTGVIGSPPYRKKIVVLMFATIGSLFFFPSETLHPIILLVIAVALSGLIVRRLRAVGMPWWLVFFGLVPLLGWVFLAVVVSRSSPWSGGGGGGGGRSVDMVVSKVLVSFVATFLTLALLVVSFTAAGARVDTTPPEPAPAAGPLIVEESEEPPAIESLPVPEEAPTIEAEPEVVDPPPPVVEEEPAPTPPTGGFEQLVAGLTVTPEVTAGYDRDFFRHWSDADGDGCDTRREVLIAESVTPVTVGGGCSLSGGEWVSAFDGVRTTDPSTFDVDHFVPLKEAWDSGAHAWDNTRRERFANDLDYAGSLIAVSASSNRSKGASDPAEWLPPNGGYHCQYVITWVEVKLRWQLSADAAEIAALRNYGARC